MIVVDASVLVELLLRGTAATLIAERLRMERETLHAPHLIDLEVVQALRRYRRNGILTTARARAALSALGELDVNRYPHDIFTPRIWQLREHVSAYDGAYLALAEALDAPLLTSDAKLAKVRGHRARIELVRRF